MEYHIARWRHFLCPKFVKVRFRSKGHECEGVIHDDRRNRTVRLSSGSVSLSVHFDICVLQASTLVCGFRFSQFHQINMGPMHSRRVRNEVAGQVFIECKVVLTSPVMEYSDTEGLRNSARIHTESTPILQFLILVPTHIRILRDLYNTNGAGENFFNREYDERTNPKSAILNLFVSLYENAKWWAGTFCRSGNDHSTIM